MSKFTRPAMLAGSWYPGTEIGLKNTIEDCFLSEFGPGELPVPKKADASHDVIGIISPHAGFRFSGGVAANGYHAISQAGIPDTIILVASHGGYDNIFIQTEGKWETPLGNLEIDSDLASRISDKSEEIIVANKKMTSMNYTDNTFELQLPFIRYLSDDIKIVPIATGTRSFEKIHSAAGELAGLLKEYFSPDPSKYIAIVASTDLTHYGPNFNFMPARGQSARDQNNWVRSNDKRVLEMIKNLENTATEDILKESLEKRNLCCPGAIILALDTIKLLVEKGIFNTLTVDLLQQATSFDVEPRGSSGSFFSAVGYASMAFRK